MKKSILKIASIMALSCLAVGAIAQANNNDDDDKKKKKKIEKRIDVVDKDGVKTVTVISIEDGKKTKVVHTGKDADDYLKEMNETGSGGSHLCLEMAFSENENNQSKQVDVKSVNGVKQVTVVTIENGINKVEVFEGDEAEKFLAEEGTMTKRGMHSMTFESDVEDMIQQFHIDFNFEELEEQMAELKLKTGEMKHLFDVQTFSDGEALPEHIEKLLEEMNISIKELQKEGGKRVMIGTMIAIEDMDNDDGVEDLEIETFNLYPNPSNGQLVVKFNTPNESPVQIDIVTLDGKQIYAQEVSGSTTYELNVNLGENASGTHIVNLIQGNKRKSKKLILQ